MLHSIQTLKRLEIGATDGNIGKVEDAYFDDARWAIRSRGRHRRQAER